MPKGTCHKICQEKVLRKKTEMTNLCHVSAITRALLYSIRHMEQTELCRNTFLQLVLHLQVELFHIQELRVITN